MGKCPFYLNPILQGVRLVDGNYEPIQAQITTFDTFWLWSEVLGLELQIVSGELRFRDPQTGKFLKTHGEAEAALQQTEATLQQTEANLQQTEAILEEERNARSQVESALRSLVCQLVNSGLEIDRVAQMTQLSAAEIQKFLADWQ